MVMMGCGDDRGLRMLTNDKPIIVAPFYVDSSGNPIGAQTPDAVTIDKVAGATAVPVIAPDGHAVTWGEFRAASGVAALTCEPGGTRVRVTLSNLIPNGVYTGWLVFFAPPGFKTAMFDALTGLAPVGPPDGSESRVVADAQGNASFDVVTPAGTTTVTLPGKTQSIPACLLDAYEVHVVAAYHIDGHTCGATQCDAGQLAEQIGWMVFGGQVQTF
jgi:hypothetical protein